MRFLVFCFIIAIMACPVFAKPDYCILLDSAVGTNAAYSAANDTTTSADVFTGYLEGIYIELSGAVSMDIDIDIQTTNGTATARTLLSVDDVTANTYYPIRLNAVSTGNSTNTFQGADCRISLVGSGFELRAYDANTNSIAVKVYCFIDK